MRMSVRTLALAACSLALAVPGAQAQDGVYLPTAPRGSGGEDRIETASGTRCSQSINSSGAYVDLGVTATAAEPLPEDRPVISYRERDRKALVYARVTIPLGKQPERLDCIRLYEAELERLRQEVELLRIAAE